MVVEEDGGVVVEEEEEEEQVVVDQGLEAATMAAGDMIDLEDKADKG